jgi:threonine-phosphate decarboxylase
MKADHGGNIYAASRSSCRDRATVWLDYSANINPLGLAASVRQAMIESLELVIHYPDVEAYQLKQALSVRYGIPSPMITVGNGAVELLYVLCHVIKPHTVLVMAPTFSEYERAAHGAGAKVFYHSLSADQGFAVDVAALLCQIKSLQPDIVFLCNPNNPTGTLMKLEEIAAIANAAAELKSLVVVDESFLDFLVLADWTCQSLLKCFANVIIAHSLTKFYAVPGLRLGFFLASEGLTKALHASKDPWNVNSIAQSAGVAALADTNYAERSRTYIEQEKNIFYHELLLIPGLNPYPPAVNYILIDISESGLTASELSQKMVKKRILIRDCSNYQGLGSAYVRLAVKCHEQNQQVIQALQSIIKGE